MEQSPNDLKQAIKNGLHAAHSPWIDHHQKELVDHLYRHIRDFVAQRFTASVLDTDPRQEARLLALFAKIVEKDEGS